MRPDQLRYTAMKLVESREYDSAIPALTALIESSADTVASDIAWRAKMYFATAQYALAISDYRLVLEIQPEDKNARYYLALMLAAAPDDKLRDGPRALQLILDVSHRLNRKTWNVMSVVAACHAECGEFNAATQLIGQVIEIAPNDMIERFKLRRKQYDEHIPYRLDSADTVQQMLNDPLVCVSCGAGAFFTIDTPDNERLPFCVDCAKHDINEQGQADAG